MRPYTPLMTSKKIKILLLVSSLVFALDHFTKWLVVKYIPYTSGFAVIENYFDLVHYRNKGAAFGFLSGWDSPFRDVVFYILALCAVFFLFSFLKQISKPSGVIPIALIFGGALGNVVDRIFRGGVVDFLSLHWHNQTVSWTIFDRFFDLNLTWPAFNVADSAISIGVVWLILSMNHNSKEMS